MPPRKRQTEAQVILAALRQRMVERELSYTAAKADYEEAERLYSQLGQIRTRLAHLEYLATGNKRLTPAEEEQRDSNIPCPTCPDLKPDLVAPDDCPECEGEGTIEVITNPQGEMDAHKAWEEMTGECLTEVHHTIPALTNKIEPIVQEARKAACAQTMTFNLIEMASEDDPQTTETVYDILASLTVAEATPSPRSMPKPNMFADGILDVPKAKKPKVEVFSPAPPKPQIIAYAVQKAFPLSIRLMGEIKSNLTPDDDIIETAETTFEGSPEELREAFAQAQTLSEQAQAHGWSGEIMVIQHTKDTDVCLWSAKYCRE